MTDGNLIRREFDVPVFIIRGISLGKGLWIVSTCRAPMKKENALNYQLKLWTHISDRILNKSLPSFFISKSHSFFIAIIQRVLKLRFGWQQLKADYSKNIWKEGNRRRGFVCSLIGSILYWKLQLCCCRSS